MKYFTREIEKKTDEAQVEVIKHVGRIQISPLASNLIRDSWHTKHAEFLHTQVPEYKFTLTQVHAQVYTYPK